MGRERADGDRVCIEQDAIPWEGREQRQTECKTLFYVPMCIEKDAIPRDRVSIGKHAFSRDREGQSVSCEGRYFYVTEGGRACT